MDSTRGYEPRDKGSIPLWANTSFLKVNGFYEVIKWLQLPSKSSTTSWSW